MDLRWLQDFLAVAETGSFTKASEIRHASQAAFSRRIQQLETWVGTKLIDRSVFPSRLTAEGEAFVSRAADLLKLAGDSRSDLFKGATTANYAVRITMPLALATGPFPRWWRDWTAGVPPLGCEVIPTNVHDAVTALASDAADLLLCFHNPQLAIHLEPARYERHVIGMDRLRPYASPALVRNGTAALKGTAENSAPLLLYSPGTYLGQLVRTILDSLPRPLAGRRSFQSDMADVLREMAIAGHGVAWLPGCCAEAAVRRGKLSVVDDAKWTLDLTYVAYRNATNENPALNRMWSEMLARTASDDSNPSRSTTFRKEPAPAR